MEVLGDLVSRVHRLQFFIDATNTQITDADAQLGSPNVLSRVQAIQRSLRHVCAAHPSAQAVLDLRESGRLSLPTLP